MATRKFIKMYNIRHDDVDDKGNINPNAALYPMYMGQYIDNKTGKKFISLPPEAIDDKLSDEDKPYDNSSNAHPNRVVHVTNGAGDIIKTVGPDLKRGYSVLSFANKDKRHGDDYFSGWRKIDRDKDIHSVVHTDASEITDNPHYGFGHGDAARDAITLASSITPGEGYKGFYTLPLIVEADDSDVINFNDVTNDNYDPTRDYLPEVQLKRIIKKSVMPNALTNNAKSAYIAKVATFAHAVLDKFLEMDNYKNEFESLASSAQDANGLYTKLLKAFETIMKYMSDVVSGVYAMDDTLEALADKDDTIDTALADMDGLTDNIEELMSDVKAAYDRCVQDNKLHVVKGMLPTRDLSSLRETASLVATFADIFCAILDNLGGMISDLQSYLSGMSDVGIPGKYIPDRDVVSKATQKGGAFDWYDRSTYSDERLKDIYSGCRDVTLSDKQMKYIYNDFRKFKKGATQNNIIKGMRGLGQ